MTPTEAERWNLWRRDPHATPFQSPAWIETWWRRLGGGERFDVAARDSAGRLIGLLPLFVWNDGGERKLAPVGAGHSDYCDALADPDHRAQAVAGLFAAIAELPVQWDAILLPDLRPGSVLLGPVPAGWRAEDADGETCPVLPLPQNAALADILPARQRRKLAMARHRAERLGEVSVRLAGPEEVDVTIDALFALHAARWQAEGKPGVLAEPRIQAFHRAAAPALAAAGLLRLVVVRHQDRAVAVLYALADRARWHGYITGVDMTVPGQSFGTLALAHALEQALVEGATEFHFLRGEEPYKFAWGAEPTSTIRRIVRRA